MVLFTFLLIFLQWSVVTLQPGFGWKVTGVITLLINLMSNDCSLINTTYLCHGFTVDTIWNIGETGDIYAYLYKKALVSS